MARGSSDCYKATKYTGGGRYESRPIPFKNGVLPVCWVPYGRILRPVPDNVLRVILAESLCGLSAWYIQLSWRNSIFWKPDVLWFRSYTTCTLVETYASKWWYLPLFQILKIVLWVFTIISIRDHLWLGTTRSYLDSRRHKNTRSQSN